MAIGSLVILLAGWSWLVVAMRTAPIAAFNVGVAPFLIGDVIKTVLAAAVLPTGWALLRRKASGQ